MFRLNPWLFAVMGLLFTFPAFAEPTDRVPRYARACQPRLAPPQNRSTEETPLWGTRQTWDGREGLDAESHVLVAVNLYPLAWDPERVKGIMLQDGHLKGSGANDTLQRTVLQGEGSHGEVVEVTLCGAEADPSDPSLYKYRLEAWNANSQEWENPCVATEEVPNPWALALGGTWDLSGAHHDTPGKFTFACQTGVLSQCVTWGYKPWARRNGRSLSEHHQACTRMVRADYCGNGKSHARELPLMGRNDHLGISEPLAAKSQGEPAGTVFEAGWAPDGASCMASPREVPGLREVNNECPGRFRMRTYDLRTGDKCRAYRADAESPPPELLQSWTLASRPGLPTKVLGQNPKGHGFVPPPRVPRDRVW